MAVTATYVDSTLIPGNITSNRPAGTYFRYICDTEADLPTANVLDGDSAFTEDINRRWLRVGGAWVLQTNDVIAAALITTSQQAALPIGAVADGQYLKRVGAGVEGAAVAGGAAWGGITGTLSDQTDLQAALDGKQPTGSYATGTGTANGTNTGDQSSVSGNAGTATALSAGADRTKLDGIAAGAEVNVNADWNAGSGDAQILNKPVTFAPSAHKTSHENGGSDELSVVGLSGLLADGQTPLAHKTSHQDGGADELALDASQTTTGQFAIARLASGTPNGSKFIRDDGTLVVPTAGAAWGAITGTLSAQTDLQAALDAKQATLVSGTNIKTVNGSTLLGSGNLAVSASDPSYTPGSFTVATGTGRLVIKRMQLVTTERATVAGTARLRVA